MSLCPAPVADMGLENVLPMLVQTDQSAVYVEDPDGRPVSGGVMVCAPLVPFPDGGGLELGSPPLAVPETPVVAVPLGGAVAFPVGKEKDTPEPGGKPVSPGGAVPLRVGDENDGPPEPDGTFVRLF